MFKLGKVIIFSMLLAFIVVSVHAGKNDKDLPKIKPKPCDCITPAVYFPVCGSDNVTYGNKYLLNCENKCNNKSITIAYDGICK